MRRVVALYIDPRGPYPKLLGLDDCYDAERDARTYQGPWPVVAHPPCGPWGKLRHRNRAAVKDLAVIAVGQVRAYGGVLEHPANSQLWNYMNLPKPWQRADDHGGFTLEVHQVEWGHVARKRTWIYMIGVPREKIPGPPFPGREPTHWIGGGRKPSKSGRTIVPEGIKVCSAEQRRRTPVAFAEWLIELARCVE